jgi:hypothetical protein
MNWNQECKQMETPKNKEDIVIEMGDKEQLVTNTTCKTFYQHYVNKLHKKHPSMEKWQNIFPELSPNDRDTWKHIYENVKKSTCSTKLCSFHYKIIHRIINCKEKLVKWNILSSPICSSCPEIETIEHMLIYCTTAKTFWRHFFNWWNGISDLKIDTNRRELGESVLFGFRLTSNEYKLLNYICIHAKFFIYKKKTYENGNLCLFEFLVTLKTNLECTLKYIKKKDGKTSFEKLYNEM